MSDVPPDVATAWTVALNRDLTPLEQWLEFFEVETKDRSIVPFVLKAPQRRLVRLIQKAWDEGHAAYVLVLKARQIGFSTLMQLIQAEGVLRWPGNLGQTFSYEQDQVEYLATKADFFMRQVPVEVRPETRLWSKKHVALRHYLEGGAFQESSLQVKTAKNTKIGRGYTVHRAHLSEPPFYDNLLGMLGIKNAVPNRPGCLCVLEFTANGYDEVYKLWRGALAGENDYVTLFCSWLEEPEYSIDPTGREDLRPRDEIERHILSTHHATPGQLLWWRWCVRNNCDGHVPSALQEYPCCAEKAFQSTGRPVFNLPNLESWLTVAREEAKKARRGNIAETTRDPGSRGTFEFVEDAEGLWTIYEPPTDGEVYAWAADTAVGLEADPDAAKSDPDYSCGTILNAKRRTKAAVYHGRPDIDVFAEEMRKASAWYGLSWGHVENNGVGQGFLTAARMLGFTNILFRTKLEPSASGDPSPEIRPGFNMNTKTKPAVILRLQKMTRDLGLVSEWQPPEDKPHAKPECPFDLPCIEEMLVFERDAMGRMAAKVGYHDDRVLSRAMAEQAIEDIDLVHATPVVGAKKAAELLTRTEWSEEWEEAEAAAVQHNIRLENLWRNR